MAISAVEPKFWRAFRDTLAPYVPEIADPRFDDAEQRHGPRGHDLAEILTGAFKMRTARECSGTEPWGRAVCSSVTDRSALAGLTSSLAEAAPVVTD